MEGVLLGLQCPLEAGLLPEGVQPGEGGEGEGRAVALVLGSQYNCQASFLLKLQFMIKFLPCLPQGHDLVYCPHSLLLLVRAQKGLRNTFYIAIPGTPLDLVPQFLLCFKLLMASCWNRTCCGPLV